MNIYTIFLLLLFTVWSSTLLPGCHSNSKAEKAGTASIVLKSTDGGQKWQDISKGLPQNLRLDTIRGNNFFANDKGLFLKIGNGLYHSTPNATDTFWTKEIVANEHISMGPDKSGIFYWGVNLKKRNGMSVWSPIFELSTEPRIRSSFETSDGTIFLGTNVGIFKTANNGETWKQVYTGGLVGHLAESDGVLMSTSMRGIIRSTDNGENWVVAVSEDAVAWDIKPINGGFVAITSVSESGKKRLSRSYDGGKTWMPIDTGLQNKALIDSIGRTWNDRPIMKAFMTSITMVGENLFCTHPTGIYKSSDKGKTWKLVLPSVEKKGFNLFVSGNVIYAIPTKGGC